MISGESCYDAIATADDRRRYDAVKSDLRTLQSQMYEVCRRSLNYGGNGGVLGTEDNKNFCSSLQKPLMSGGGGGGTTAVSDDSIVFRTAANNNTTTTSAAVLATNGYLNSQTPMQYNAVAARQRYGNKLPSPVYT
uniref:Uncharacterized protein n=1 Tax=Lymantria dispar multicapsid nuclear polyhedrosis virus TaxID=10449 RepID=A0A1B1MR06_NPVLD|nr:hypothetical protein [Lymantria dispar multiple nucleopolyhedrovirus]